MGRSQESFGKKAVRNRKEKKRKDKEKKRLEKKETGQKSSMDDMIAYVDENGMITSTPPDPADKTEIDPEDIEIGVPSRETVAEDPIKSGIVTFFNQTKGFGFIREIASGRSIFFHVNNVTGEVDLDNRVSFEIAPGTRGPEAVEVKREG